MKNTYLKILITVIAAVLAVVRIVKPDIEIDSTILILFALAILPWLSSLIKRVKIPGGLEIEFQEMKAEARDAVNGGKELPEQNSQQKPAGLPGYYWDSYMMRLLKLTPIEFIVAFVVTSAMISQASPALSPDLEQILAWTNFGGLTVLTLLYLWRVSEVNSPAQLIVSTIGFVVWVFALGGPFTVLDWYSPLYGALVLAVYIVVTPIITT